MQQPRTGPGFEKQPQMKPPAVSLLNDMQWQFLQRRFRITPRELEIARLICRGLSNDDVASSLDITSGTVKVHLRSLYRKTWVENRILMLLRFIETSSHLFPSDPADSPPARALSSRPRS